MRTTSWDNGPSSGDFEYHPKLATLYMTVSGLGWLIIAKRGIAILTPEDFRIAPTLKR